MIRIRQITENGEAVAYRRPSEQAPHFGQIATPVCKVRLPLATPDYPPIQ